MPGILGGDLALLKTVVLKYEDKRQLVDESQIQFQAPPPAWLSLCCNSFKNIFTGHVKTCCSST